MKIIFKIILFGFLSILVFSACEQKRKKQLTYREVKAYKKPLEKVNTYLIKKDEETISKHCQRRGWNMEMTKSGMWYGKLRESANDSVQEGDIVEIKYEIKLLDGTLLYDSDTLGTKIFRVGQGGVENGLEEGILMMKKNEEYRFIMPPHKAHGLLGDMHKIPARSIIVYYVELLHIN